MMFLRELEDFLLNLRDDYGFLIPVDRLKQCLSCFGDITDLEEVLYRSQSLICENEEQIDMFRSLFAQRFLNIKPTKSLSNSQTQPKQTQTPGLLTDAGRMTLEDKLSGLKLDIENNEREIQEIVKVKQELGTYARELSARASALDSEAQALKDEKIRLHAEGILNTKNPKLMAQYNAVEKQLKDNCISKTLAEKIKKAMLSIDFKKELDALIKEVMAAASKARSSQDMKKFKACLDLVAAIKKFQTTAGKNIVNTNQESIKKITQKLAQNKKDLEQVKSKIYDNDQKYSDAGSKSQRLFSLTSLAKNQINDIERKLKTDQELKAKLPPPAPALVVKEAAKSHRSIFEQGIHAVQTTAEQAELLRTSLSSMSAADKQRILSYIRAHAKIFRQTLRRKSSTPRHHQVDVRSTIRAASKTGGEPVLIRYKKPKKSHAKVIILVDISGSCRHASTLALYFMAMMNEAFPGGCRKFAFVNSLVPVDKYFRDKSADEGVNTVIKIIPTRGIYSDYGRTIHSLKEEFGGTIHKDTTVIVIGDARNNRNKSAAEDLKFIAGRCHRVFWLNPEPKAKWDTGDSMMGQYVNAGAEAHYVKTAGDLLSFLGNLSVSRS